MSPMRSVAIFGSLLLLFSIASAGLNNDLFLHGINDPYYYTENLASGSANFFKYTETFGGCQIAILDTSTRRQADVDCIGQWILNGKYAAGVDFYNGYYQDNSDDDNDFFNSPGPFFTLVSGGDYYYYDYSPAYYDRSIGVHTAIMLRDDGTTVMYSGFRNLGSSRTTVTLNSGPRQLYESYAHGNGWLIADKSDYVNTTADGDTNVEDSDNSLTVTSLELLLTISNRGDRDQSATQQSVAYDTTNVEDGRYGPSGALELEVTHTFSLAAGETKAILTFFQICDSVRESSCTNRAANLANEVAIFNAGYVNWLGAVQLSQVINYDAVALATGVFGGDPHMTPLTGVRRTEDIHGVHGDIVNVISDADLVVNMRLKEVAALRELGAEATYIEALALQFVGGDRLLVTVADGLGYELSLNGETLSVGDIVAVEGARIMVQDVPTAKTFKGWFNARYAGHQLQAMIHVITDTYNIELFPVYKDNFVNWHTANPGAHTLIETHSFLDMDVSLLKRTSDARGILGETAHVSLERETQTLDARVKHYKVASMFDTSFQ